MTPSSPIPFCRWQGEVRPSELGIWHPAFDGIPPLSSLAAAGINGTFISGNIDAAVLASFDVLFLGRDGMRFFTISDIDALDRWYLPAGKSWRRKRARVARSSRSKS